MLKKDKEQQGIHPSTNYRVVEASFVISAPDLKSCPEPDLPEVAVVGRSNVGKSSLINLICNRKNLAKTSGTPGKTRLLNYFLLRIEPENHHLHLVDLPGFGYSKAGKAFQHQWAKSLENYFLKRKNLKGVLQLIDSRHNPTSLDLQMREWIVHAGLPSVTILTKVDKLSKNALIKSRKNIMKILHLSSDETCIISSTVKKQGIDEIVFSIISLISQ